MKVPGIEAEQLPPRDCVSEIELVRADDVALGTDAEELCLHRVELPPRIEGFGEYGVERLREPLTRTFAIRRRIFETIRCPHVRHARRAERLTHRGPDLAARDAVLNPKIANAFVLM